MGQGKALVIGAIGFALGGAVGFGGALVCSSSSFCGRMESVASDATSSGEGKVCVHGEPISEHGDGFVEAIPASKYKREPQSVVVEEARDEDGLTAQERIERFQREHPEEYARMVEAREKRIADRRAAEEKRQTFLDTVDVSLFNETERKTHQAYADALAERDACREEIRELRRNGQQVTQELRNRMSEAARQVEETTSAEREALLHATARALGVKDDATAEFASTIRSIYEATEPRRRRW